MKSKRSDVHQKWVEKCFKQRLIEIMCGIAIVILLAFGAIFDALEIHFLFVNDFSNISLTALQIQASISTISIALVALVSGVISDEYYGISITHFFLNIKPLLFKQDKIIISLICLVAINIGAHLLGAYNLVISILWASCVIIIISVTQIYATFNGRHATIVEVETYLDYILFDPSIPFEKKANYFSNYVYYWSLLSQNRVDYESEKQRYAKAISDLLEKDAEKTLLLLQLVSADLIKKYIAVNDINKRYRAIEIFEESYTQIWLHIVNHKFTHINVGFELYSECVDELIPGIATLPTDSFEKTVRWERLTNIISRINIYCHSEKETDSESFNKNIKLIQWIPSAVGGVIAEKRKSGERININHWRFSRGLMVSYNANIPNSVDSDYKKAKRRYALAFYYSLIQNSQLDIASTVFNNFSLESSRNKYDDIVFSLLIICYTYYIAERESTMCISSEEKETAHKALEIFKKNDIFLNTIYTICWHCDHFDFSELYDELRFVLNDYERMPFDGSCKACIVDHVVMDFVLLVTVLSCAYGTANKLLENITSGKKVFSWYSSYLGDHFNNTEKQLNKIMQALCDESKSTLNAEWLMLGLGEFNSFILKRYKEQIIIDARKEYEDFLSINSAEKLIRSLENSLGVHLQKKCNEWLEAPKRNYTEERFLLIHLPTPVNSIDENIKAELIPILEGNFIKLIGARLNKLNKLNIFSREKVNEKDYFSVLSSSQFTLVGPDWAFKPYDYKKRTEFDHQINGYRRINMGNGNCGILLGMLPVPIEIKKVSISTHQMNISECDYRINEEGLYEYSPWAGQTLMYTKEELEEYLSNEIIVLDVTVKLNIQNPPSNCGYFIIKNN